VQLATPPMRAAVAGDLGVWLPELSEGREEKGLSAGVRSYWPVRPVRGFEKCNITRNFG
jgi:hypothetical protein